jgi:hypothetical protein
MIDIQTRCLLLAAGGELALEPGKVKRGKDPRLEVVRLKQRPE